MRRTPRLGLIMVIGLFAGGCGLPRATVDLCPAGAHFEDTGAEDVRVYAEGERPQRPHLRLADLQVFGSMSWSREDMYADLRDEAAEVGAAFVVILDSQLIQAGESGFALFGLYGGAINYLRSVRAYAGRFSKVSLGMACDEATGYVDFVAADGPAAKAGITEDCRLLAVNDRILKGAKWVMSQEVHAKSPGEVVRLVFLTPQGEKKTAQITLAAPSKTELATPDEPHPDLASGGGRARQKRRAS